MQWDVIIVLLEAGPSHTTLDNSQSDPKCIRQNQMSDEGSVPVRTGQRYFLFSFLHLDTGTTYIPSDPLAGDESGITDIFRVLRVARHVGGDGELPT